MKTRGQKIMKTGRQKIKKAILVLSVLMITTSGLAQLPPVFDDSMDDTTTTTAPISSFVVIGLIAGAIYGVKKIR